MKKVVFIAVIALVGLGNVNAQKNVVKVNPLGLVFGSTEIGYERVLSEKSSVELALAYSSSSVTLGGSTSSDATGFGAEGKYKFYFSSSKDAPKGWYVAPVVTYTSTTAESGGSKGKLSSFGGGALAGYQWVFGGGDSGFALDLNFGAQYVSAEASGDITSFDLSGFVPKLGLSLGYAW
jgi:hypothetical protein